MQLSATNALVNNVWDSLGSFWPNKILKSGLRSLNLRFSAKSPTAMSYNNRLFCLSRCIAAGCRGFLFGTEFIIAVATVYTKLRITLRFIGLSCEMNVHSRELLCLTVKLQSSNYYTLA